MVFSSTAGGSINWHNSFEKMDCLVDVKINRPCIPAILLEKFMP